MQDFQKNCLHQTFNSSESDDYERARERKILSNNFLKYIYGKYILHRVSWRKLRRWAPPIQYT